MFHGNTPLAQAPLSFTVDNTANPVKNLSENPWWHEVGSRELNSFVAEALDNNKQVSIASKNIEIAQSALDTVRLGWLPTISMMTGQIQSNGLVLLPNLPVPLAGSGGFFAFLPTWVVNIVQLPNQSKVAEKKLDVTVADYLAMRSSIAAQVVSSYALLLATIEEEKILNDLSNNLNDRFKTAGFMISQGLETEISVREQDSQRQKIKVQLATNRSNQIAAKNALLTLVGRPLSDFTPSEKLSMLNLDYISPGNTPTSVLATRPDVVAARAKIQAADYDISATASSLVPTPTLATASITAWAKADGSRDTLNETLQMGLATWTLNPQVIGQISSSNKQYDRAVINYMNVVDNAIKEVDNALADFVTKQTTLIKEEQIVANSRKNLATYQAMFKSGLLSGTQYLQSVGQFDQANMAIVQAKLQTITSLTKLYQSMGGGATYNLKNYSLKDQSIVGIDSDNTKN
ncbi:MAG: TolC family protein [Sheuella sp.]|nr:TolC family protein [Sheuella sp.]